MGLVPTKSRMFLRRRKILRFVGTRPAREGGNPDTPCRVPEWRHDCLVTRPRHSPNRSPMRNQIRVLSGSEARPV